MTEWLAPVLFVYSLDLEPGGGGAGSCAAVGSQPLMMSTACQPWPELDGPWCRTSGKGAGAWPWQLLH
jgi:hypothetical protein